MVYLVFESKDTELAGEQLTHKRGSSESLLFELNPLATTSPILASLRQPRRHAVSRTSRKISNGKL